VKLLEKLNSLKPQMATAAQSVIDDWQQNEDGFDEELGSGGVCDKISEAIAAVISENTSEVEFADGGHEGDDHAYLIVFNNTEAYAIDVPPDIYETGGGYNWKKLEGATISTSDVVITKVDRDLIVNW